MKESTIFNIALLAMSIGITLWYYLLCKKNGLKSSISAGAEDFQEQKKEHYTYIFIGLGLVIPFAWLGHTYITAISAALLLPIGLITGYNKALKVNKLQDTMHIIFVQIPILGYVVGICLKDLWNLVFLAILLLVILYRTIKKQSGLTRKIEYDAIIFAWVCVSVGMIGFKNIINYIVELF